MEVINTLEQSLHKSSIANESRVSRQKINAKEGKKQGTARIAPKVLAKGKDKEQIFMESKQRKTLANKPLATLRTLVEASTEGKYLEDRNKERLRGGKEKDMASTRVWRS